MNTTVTAKRYPTRLHVRCPQCGHQGIAKVFLDTPPRLVCKKCGSRDAIVTERDRTRTWRHIATSKQAH